MYSLFSSTTGCTSLRLTSSYAAVRPAGPAPMIKAVLCFMTLVMRGRNVIGRKRRALTEEVLLHLLNQKFLSFPGTKVQTVLVHQHFHMLNPHAPGLFRDVFVNTLAQRVPLKRNFVEAWHLALKFYAIHHSRRGGRRIIHIGSG